MFDSLHQSFIDGQWLDAQNSQTFPLLNPANETVISHIADCGEIEAISAIESSQKAFIRHLSTPAKIRAQWLKRWHDLILEHQESLAELMTLECGKPLAEAIGEVKYAASYVEWFAEEAKRIRGDTIPHPTVDRRMMAQRVPVGVCAAITPWNFPMAMITRKCAPALAAGCAVVVKPAEFTPKSALALAKLAELAGIPSGLFNVITTTQSDSVGKVLTTHPLVKKVSFTGSTQVGKKILKQSADTVKKVTLELGGNAPFIVFEDANVELAIKGALASKFRNSGQTCVCANRFLVHESIADDFEQQLAKKVEDLTIGDGFESNTAIGPLINEAAVQKVSNLVDEACESGAKLLTGGKKGKQAGHFFEPSVIACPSTDINLFDQEIFGPVAAVYRFETEDEAIELANRTKAGLAAYFYTENLQRIVRVSESLEFGMVGVNEGVLSSELAPFGGVKESGIGREGSHLGIDEYLEVKYVCIGGLA